MYVKGQCFLCLQWECGEGGTGPDPRRHPGRGGAWEQLRRKDHPIGKHFFFCFCYLFIFFKRKLYESLKLGDTTADCKTYRTLIEIVEFGSAKSSRIESFGGDEACFETKAR